MPHLVYSLRDDTPHTRHATDWTAPLRQQHAGQLARIEHDAVLVRAHVDEIAARVAHWCNSGGMVHVDLLAELLVEDVRPAQRRLAGLIDTVRAES